MKVQLNGFLQPNLLCQNKYLQTNSLDDTQYSSRLPNKYVNLKMQMNWKILFVRTFPNEKIVY